MSDTLAELYQRLAALQQDLLGEIRRARRRFSHTLERNRVIFDPQWAREHKAGWRHLFRYVLGAHPKHVLTAPVIYSCIVPALLLDLWVSAYHAICFPVWGIPKVKRRDYIVVDRHHLPYLNLLEKLNCLYCGYFNGLIAYVREIAGRTEQYWCPIKHARQPRSIHNRYPLFVDYGDAEEYRRRLVYLRRHFDPAPLI